MGSAGRRMDSIRETSGEYPDSPEMGIACERRQRGRRRDVVNQRGRREMRMSRR